MFSFASMNIKRISISFYPIQIKNRLEQKKGTRYKSIRPKSKILANLHCLLRPELYVQNLRSGDFPLPALVGLPGPAGGGVTRGRGAAPPPGQGVVVVRALLRIGEGGVRRVHSHELVAGAARDVGVQSPRQPPVGRLDLLSRRADLEP